MNPNKFSNGLLLAISAAGLLLLAYLFTSFSLTIFRSWQWIYYYLLVIVPPVILLFAFRLDKNQRINIAIAVTATALTLYAVEGGLLWLGTPKFSKGQARIAAAEQAGLAFDTRTKLEVIDQLEQQGVTSVPRVSPMILVKSDISIIVDGHEVMPLAGISNILTVYCNESGNFVTYQSDEHGFRNPTGLYDVNRLELALVGDSFTQGSCVKTGAETATLLRKVYPKTLNFGFGGDGPLLELASLREFAAPLEPKIVLWFYYEGNDLLDLETEKQNKILTKYLEPDFSQGLVSLQSGLDRQMADYVEQEKAPKHQENSSVLQLIRRHPLTRFILLTQLRRHLSLFSDRPDEPFDRELFGKVMGAAQTLTASWGGRLYFVYLPEWQRFSAPGQGNSHREQVLQLVRDHDIPIIDLYPVFAAQPEPLSNFPFGLNGHYNEAGYRLVSETILDQIPSVSVGYRKKK